MAPINHHVDHPDDVNVRSSIMATVHLESHEVLSCICGRLQYIPYPKARCICGELPLKVTMQIEEERKRRIQQKIDERLAKEQEAAAEMYDRTNRSDNDDETLSTQKWNYRSTLYTEMKKESKNITQYVNQQQEQRRAVQHRHQEKFHQKVEKALIKKYAAEAAVQLSDTHAKYLAEKKVMTSAIRLKQNRVEREGERRKKLIAKAVRGEWTGTRPTSRIKRKEEEERIRKERMELERERRKEEEIDMNKEKHMDQIVEESMMAPEEIEKKRDLEDRWRKYKRSQAVMREAIRLKEEAEKEAERIEAAKNEEKTRLWREEEERKFLEMHSEEDEED